MQDRDGCRTRTATLLTMRGVPWSGVQNAACTYYAQRTGEDEGVQEERAEQRELLMRRAHPREQLGTEESMADAEDIRAELAKVRIALITLPVAFGGALGRPATRDWSPPPNT
eukprot:8992222-Pyramimonas_sp.AAC.1